jgi:chromosome segregation ATPase
MVLLSIIQLGILIAADTWVAIVPIVTMIISGVFTYIGYVFSSRAKSQDVKLAEKTQEFDGIKIGQEFVKDALADARMQITELKAQYATLKAEYDASEIALEKATREAERLTIELKSAERKINSLEKKVEQLKAGE